MKRIVVGTDGSPTAQQAVNQAADLAVATGADLHIVTAYRSPAAIGAMTATAAAAGMASVDCYGLSDSLAKDAEAGLARAAATVAGRGVRVESHGAGGDPAEVILDVAEAVDADLIVVGSRGMTGAKRFVLGSVPNKVAHHACCNVMIVYTSGSNTGHGHSGGEELPTDKD